MAFKHEDIQDFEEIRLLSQARNSVLYGNADRPLIAWTLSPEWTQVPAGRSQAPIHGEFWAK